MKCPDVRWQLSRFLSGETTPTEDELIRDHFDHCPDCTLRLVSNGRIDKAEAHVSASATAKITAQVLAYYPESPSGMIMVRHLTWVFAISASFAVVVYMFVRQMLTAAPLSATNPISRFNEGGVEEVLAVFSSNPLVSYVLLAVLAAVLCVALVLFVDRPDYSHREFVRTNR